MPLHLFPLALAYARADVEKAINHHIVAFLGEPFISFYQLMLRPWNDEHLTPNPQSQSFSRSCGSILPTSLT